MKRNLCSLPFLCLLILASPLLTHASPVYLTYTSVITYESITSGYDYGIHVGDTITHTYLADKSLPGYYRNGSNTFYMQDENTANGTNDYYYSQLISGNLLSNPYYAPADTQIDDRYSYDQFNLSGSYVKSMSWAGDDFGSHLVNSSDPKERGGLFYHYLGATGYEEDRILFSLVTFSVQPVPVPESSSLLISGIGILMAGAYIRRRFF